MTTAERISFNAAKASLQELKKDGRLKTYSVKAMRAKIDRYFPKLVCTDRCIDSGYVSIETTLHYVKSRFVACNSSLNSRAWDTTEPVVLCSKCFPEDFKIPEIKVHQSKQLDLFG